MYITKNDDAKIAVLWSTRCACTSIKNWFYFYGREEIEIELTVHERQVKIPSLDIHYFVDYSQAYPGDIPRLLDSGYTVALVVRNPVTRFVSMLPHPFMDQPHLSFRVKNSLRKSAERLLTAMEAAGPFFDHHTCPQSWLGERYSTENDLEGVHIIRCEDNVIEKLNEIFPTSVSNGLIYSHNTSSTKIKLSSEMDERVRRVYSRDMLLFKYE